MTRLRVVATVLCATACIAAGATIAGASAGTPEVDRANATIQLTGSLKPVTCLAEDGTGYVTEFGSYQGGETQILPDATDYPLKGSLHLDRVVWTVNSKTNRGVLTANATLRSSTGVTVFSGTLTLITQGWPPQNNGMTGRGWIVATFKAPDEGATPGDDSLIANVEFKLGLTSATAEFGDSPASFGTPNYSVVTNVAPSALDGVC
jgi:hypothetical protein